MTKKELLLKLESFPDNTEIKIMDFERRFSIPVDSVESVIENGKVISILSWGVE